MQFQMRPKGSADLLSDRRRRALKLLDEDLSLNEVARRVHCAASSVMRWRNDWRRRGADSLRVGFSPGRPRKLTRSQERRLLRILLKGAIANGYRTELWTTKRVAEVIRRTFHVPCHFNTAGLHLHRFGWTHQKPEAPALERDEKAIARWKRKGGQDLGTPGLHSLPASSPRASGQNLGHFRNFAEPAATSPGSLLSALLRQHRPRRGLCVSA